MRRGIGTGGLLRLAAMAVILLLVVGRPRGVRAQPETAAAPITGVPVRLVLPSIAVDAGIGAFALNADRSMPAPLTASQVAWYNYSAAAGGRGNTVLAAHRDWQRQRGAFYDLGKIREGDDVWLQDSAGNFYQYAVVWTLSMADDSAPVDDIAGPTEVSSVTLITCSGVFDRGMGRYVERRIVRAQLVTVVPADLPEQTTVEEGDGL